MSESLGFCPKNHIISIAEGGGGGGGGGFSPPFLPSSYTYSCMDFSFVTKQYLHLLKDYLKQIVVISDISLKCWPAGEISSPVTVGTICIRKEVISLQFPCLVSLVQSI